MQRSPKHTLSSSVLCHNYLQHERCLAPEDMWLRSEDNFFGQTLVGSNESQEIPTAINISWTSWLNHGEGAFASDFIILMLAVVRLRHTRAKLQEPVTSLDLPWGAFRLRLPLTLIPSYRLSHSTPQRCFPHFLRTSQTLALFEGSLTASQITAMQRCGELQAKGGVRRNVFLSHVA